MSVYLKKALESDLAGLISQSFPQCTHCLPSRAGHSRQLCNNVKMFVLPNCCLLNGRYLYTSWNLRFDAIMFACHVISMLKSFACPALPPNCPHPRIFKFFYWWVGNKTKHQQFRGEDSCQLIDDFTMLGCVLLSSPAELPAPCYQVHWYSTVHYTYWTVTVQAIEK